MLNAHFCCEQDSEYKDMNWTELSSIWLRAVVLVWLAHQTISTAHADCSAPAPVCAWTSKIVGIKTPNMIASGVQISPDFIVTNRHVAEDHREVLTRNHKVALRPATPIPHDFAADLVVLRLQDSEAALPAKVEAASMSSPQLYVVGFDQGRNAARVYTPAEFAHYPNSTAFPQARIHTDARALPGNSGGAVVDAEGRLVGILASGDGKLSEVIPAEHINVLLSRSGPQHETAFFDQGKALRICADTLYFAAEIPRNPPLPLIRKISDNCMKARNKQLYDQAGQLFGKWWMFTESEQFLLLSQTADPNSPNTLMSLAVTYHLDRRPEKGRPVLRRYLELDPANAQALRLGIQTAGLLKDRAFADEVLELMRQHNPAALPLAESFISEAFAN